ncbi:S8 family peptidase [Desulfocurvibacter africanus]|nr:S8 family peptidase [Desulfocurvibacter africanus]
MYLEFEGAPGFDLATKSLEDLGAGIRLLNVATVPSVIQEMPVTRATVYIPAGKEIVFLKKIRSYADHEKDSPKSNKPRNATLIDSIESIRLAFLDSSFWRDDPALIPRGMPEWCEVWLRGEEEEIEISFRKLARGREVQIQDGALRFPERTVLLIKANQQQLAELIDSCEYLAEFRLAKETARFFLDLANVEQVDWIKSLLSRLEASSESPVAISILDTGVNNGHPLLAPLLANPDCHTVDPRWGVHDHDGHGTLMCGLAGYGNLQQALESDWPVVVPHRLESVKILPPVGENDPKLYGLIVTDAVSRVEIEAPDKSRFLCIAVTSLDSRDRGRPSSWSAAIDILASGYEDDRQRLFIVSAGNVDGSEWERYPASNLTSSIHDPGQSWNAITVGAYTEKTHISSPDLVGYVPVAPAGGLSPFSTTSLTWEDKKWPAKPDVVLEGGNAIKDESGFCSECDDASILSTCYKPTKSHFDWINATSAATAQCGWIAAQIQARYSHAWPETVRGLIVHSAEWTDTMKSSFLESSNKSSYARLKRICGYGVPSLQRALYCASNSLTLIAQETLQPFDKKPEGASGYRTKDMHLHKLPWPKEVLLALGELDVTMRITLSYFIEPGPGEVGWKDRYRYASHALRFDLNKSGETEDDFLKRLNKAAREEGEETETESDSNRWLIGANGRSLGSIHSDYWHGTAAQMSDCNLIGIYPKIGWWRERAWLGRWNRMARYSLIVSLNTPKQDIDIYTPVAIQVGIPITI